MIFKKVAFIKLTNQALNTENRTEIYEKNKQLIFETISSKLFDKTFDINCIGLLCNLTFNIDVASNVLNILKEDDGKLALDLLTFFERRKESRLDVLVLFKTLFDSDNSFIRSIIYKKINDQEELKSERNQLFLFQLLSSVDQEVYIPFFENLLIEPIDQYVLKKLFEMDKCVICLDSEPEKEKVILVEKKPALHVFHKECSDQWVIISDSCPCCRSNVIAELSVVKKDQDSYISFKDNNRLNQQDSHPLVEILNIFIMQSETYIAMACLAVIFGLYTIGYFDKN